MLSDCIFSQTFKSHTLKLVDNAFFETPYNHRVNRDYYRSGEEYAAVFSNIHIPREQPTDLSERLRQDKSLDHPEAFSS